MRPCSLAAIGWVGEPVGEAYFRQLIVGKRAAELDGFGVLAVQLKNQPVRPIDGPSLRVQLLPVEIEGGEDLAHIGREAHHILAQVQREIGVVV